MGPSDSHERKGQDTKHVLPSGPDEECTSDACVVFPHISAWWTRWCPTQSDCSCCQWSDQTAPLRPHCRRERSEVLSLNSFMNMFFLQQVGAYTPIALSIKVHTQFFLCLLCYLRWLLGWRTLSYLPSVLQSWKVPFMQWLPLWNKSTSTIF